MKTIIFLSVLSVASSATIPGLKERIYSGTSAQPGQFPHHASVRSIETNQPNYHFCNGVLANNRWVITSAGCALYRTPTSTVIVLGAVHRVNGGTQYSIASIILHPDFDDWRFTDNIALIKTTEQVAVTAYVSPIALGSSYIGCGVLGVIPSFIPRNSDIAGVINPEDLKYLVAETISNSRCVNAYRDNSKLIPDEKICTHAVTGEMCGPTFGSGLVVANSVVSISSSTYICGEDLPNIHERLYSHRNWILSHIES
ncbi:Peptidase S1 domain-containing protein [Sergentomyia squamirostris]